MYSKRCSSMKVERKEKEEEEDAFALLFQK
jgi:hypothetical protein